ncbi:hypothetical protein SAMN02983003_0617 [Devosia enhydra]|uniref:Uncharacterized protein n=1 Tax=Devosia enhydra TaxID=665118 RepID=A0A1K2HTP0_9HYPH|nr:hypothetical protein [Devosia enhydra]SFZ81654.1 hypothetical protein SAMN02983003_0617 [Devosia enhydra]
MTVAYDPLPEDTASNLGFEGAALSELHRAVIRSVPHEDNPHAFGEAVTAAFQRGNILASIWHELTDGDDARKGEEVAGYNPYAALKDQYDTETLGKIKGAISDGDFDGVRSDRQLKAVVDDILYEQDLLGKMEGDVVGAFIGDIFGALADPTTYIPLIGVASKAGMVGRAGLLAFNTALQTTVSEGILQSTQRSRTLEESLMNIGIGAAVGGGLGIFAGALHPRSALNPKNPDLVFKRENLRRDGEITTTSHGARDELSGEEIADLINDADALERVHDRMLGASAGAKALDETSVTIARSEPTGPVGRLVRKAGDLFNSATIKGQVLRAASPVARSVGARIFDPAGIILESNLKFVGNARTATALKSLYSSEFERLANRFETTTRELKMEIGKAVKGISQSDLYLLTQRHLYSTLDDPKVKKLEAKYGEHFAKLDAKAKELSERVHALNDVWTARLQKWGKLQDPMVTADLKAQLVAAREAVKVADKTDVKAVEALRAKRDHIAKLYANEARKPVPLGRDYGHAQLWNRDAVVQNEAGTKAFLHKILAARPEQEWLIANHHMGLAEFDALDDAAKQAIREDWAGDGVVWRIEQAEHQVRAALQADKTAKLDLMDTMRNLRIARRDEMDITLSEARKRRDALHARVEANRTKKALWEKDVRAFIEASTAAKMTTADRTARTEAGIQTAFERTQMQRATKVEVTQQKLDATIEDLLTDPATPVDASGNPRVLDAGDYVRAEKAAAEAPEKLARADATARQDIDNVRVETARQQGKAREAAVGLRQLEREALELEQIAQQLDEAYRKADALHEGVTKARQNLTLALRSAKETRGITAKTAKAAVRELRAAKRKTPLSEVIDEVYDNIARRGVAPHGIMERALEISDRESGRIKERVLSLTRDQRAEAIQQGWLRDDLSLILRMQYDQLASDLSFDEALGIGKGQRFSSWEDVRKTIEYDYSERIAAAKDQAEKNALNQEQKVTLANIEEARARHKGGNFVDDGTSTGWMNWGMEKFTKLNLLRYNSGFTVSSMTDVAAVALRHGNPAALLAKYGKQAAEIMRQSQADDPTHFKSLIAAVELSGAHASAARFGVEDVTTGGLRGYGIGIGAAKKITGAVDKGLEIGTEIGHRIGGLGIWNGGWKVIAGLAMMDNLNTLTRRALIPAGQKGELTALEMADLASLGIGRKEATRIAGFLEKHGETLPNGRFDPHLERWEGGDGAEAARDVELALLRDMNRAITTPDVGDTPRLMSKPLARFLLAFQTFTFTFANQVGYPLAQRLTHFQDKRAITALGMLLGSGMAVMVAKDLINGRDPSERFTSEKIGNTVYELVDRTGMLGYMSPYIDSTLKLTSGITGFGGGSRYARNGWAESLLGINFALGSDVQKAGSAVAGMFSDEPDPDVMRKVMALMPYKMQANLLGRLTGLKDE